MEKFEQYYVVIPNQGPYLAESITTIERDSADLIIGLSKDSSKLIKFRHGNLNQDREPTPREDVLNEAAQLITGDRNKTYGSPTQNFQDTAAIWTVSLRHKLKDGVVLDGTDVAKLMIGLKLARITAQPKRDNWVDIAGYAGCGYEVGKEKGIIND